MKELIRKGFIKQYLEDGKTLESVYAFCKKLKIEEDSFYKSYNSLEMVERDIWVGFHEETMTTLNADATYQNYSAREKLLAYYFSLIHKFRQNRSYILLQKKKMEIDMDMLKNNHLTSFKKSFEEYVKEILIQGIGEKEVIERKFITDKYPYGFWLQLLFVVNYWIKDESPDFEQTDAAIEKAVNLSFRLIGENTLDSIIDFGKFILQRK